MPRSNRLTCNPRHLTPMPAEKLASTPFVFDPARAILICSFPRRPGGPLPQERQCLERVQARIGRLDRAMPLSPFWVWPDREDITPIRSADPAWLNHWSRDRAAFQLRAWPPFAVNSPRFPS